MEVMSVVPLFLLQDFFQAIGFNHVPNDMGTFVRPSDNLMYFVHVTDGMVDLDDVLTAVDIWEGTDGARRFLDAARAILQARLQNPEET